MRSIHAAVAIVCLPALAAGVAHSSRQGNPTKLDFVRDIQPIFAERCYACHGQATRLKDYRLDEKGSALRTNPGGAKPIDPSHPESSLLIHMVEGKGGKRMPPQGSPLTSKQISLLKQWIKQGAEWPESAASLAKSHWAYRKIVRPTTPTGIAWKPFVGPSSSISNPIDGFVTKFLREKGVQPSPAADRITLLRRMHFDLIGLPPTREETQAFLADTQPGAVDRLADRLLASAHFGERWGRRWLDLARYADSDGYEKDNIRPHAWRYRDWVIDAVNADMPFDQFTLEQLAGDLLPNATLNQKIATGFHRNTLTNTEGGTDQEEFRCKAVADRVTTTGTIWLGLTLNCTECHDHKYDPFTQKEFYQLYAFFNSQDEVNIPAPLPSEQSAYEAAVKEHRAKRDILKREVDAEIEKLKRTVIPARLASWESGAAKGLALWNPLHLVDSATQNGATVKTYDGGVFQASGKNPETETYSLTAKLEASAGRPITAIRLEALADRSLPSSGPGRTPHGNFVLTGIKLIRRVPGKADQPVHLVRASATFTQRDFDPAGALDDNPRSGWAVGGGEGKSHNAVFELASALSPVEGEQWVVALEQQYGSGPHTLGKGRLSFTQSSGPIQSSAIPDKLVKALNTPFAQRTADQQSEVLEHYLTLDVDAGAQRKRLVALEAQAPKAPSTLAQTLVEGKGRATAIHIRGDFQQRGDLVQPAGPATLPTLRLASTISSEAKLTRIDLAKWLVDPENPLTARVAANRIWMGLFGKGLVGTPEDFGVRGERPSNQPLLDWLASEYMRQGWSLKRMIKQIVTSKTYQQSSAARPDLAQRDANNLWLARQNRIRVDAEIVRDASLAVSGLLSRKVGGPSVRPPLPSGIAELGYSGSVRWENSQGEDRYRRGMYIFFQRTVPYPMLTTFDAPDGVLCAARRERSNTPLQALTLLNDPVFVECAQALGKRIAAMSGDDPMKLSALWESCVTRQPSGAEIAKLRKALTDVSRLTPANAENRDAAIWFAMARIALNADEFFVRE